MVVPTLLQVCVQNIMKGAFLIFTFMLALSSSL